MARTSIPITIVGFQQGTQLSYTAADSTNGMMFDNAGDTTLIIKNGSGASINVTINAVADEAGRSVNYVQAVAAGAEAIIAHLRPAWWNQRNSDTGKVYVDFSASTTVSVAALKTQR
jgi:hypothetical protein